MARICHISIQNFKFFRQPESFDLEGRHLLVYGENGSGKSSLYWAVYTLLECANKADDTEITNYFTPGSSSTLTNIFLPSGGPGYVASQVKIELDDGTVFGLSQTDVSLRSNMDAKEANYASEFLSYKMLFRIHDFTHNSEIDLFSYFDREVFPYVKFAPVKYWRQTPGGSLEEAETDSAKEIASLVATGPPKSGFNKKSEAIFPRRDDPERATYDNAVKGFKREIESLITYINTEGNPILENEFHGDFQFGLELVEVEPYRIADKKFIAPKFEIRLKVPTFRGAGPVLKPQSFLNEARLSILGLSIRFAILKKRLQTAKLKLALLDDFMISLDMNNRDVALDYVFDTVASGYQTILLTHDRFFYEMAKDKLRRKGQSTLWKTYQMFEAFDDEDDPINSQPKPCIIEEKGKVRKARALFHSKDYASAANMIRQSTEKLCTSYLTHQERLRPNYTEKNLVERVDKFIEKATIAGVNTTLLNDLSLYKTRLMDLGSHHDIETPLFRNELRKAIETMEQIKIDVNLPDL